MWDLYSRRLHNALCSKDVLSTSLCEVFLIRAIGALPSKGCCHIVVYTPLLLLQQTVRFLTSKRIRMHWFGNAYLEQSDTIQYNIIYFRRKKKGLYHKTHAINQPFPFYTTNCWCKKYATSMLSQYCATVTHHAQYFCNRGSNKCTLYFMQFLSLFYILQCFFLHRLNGKQY